jgi:hypothetical protein
MGNRAAVVFTKGDDISPAAYLHHHGGAESVYSFLAELNRRKCGRGQHVIFVAARFVHVVADFFDSDEATHSSIGILNGPAEISVEGLATLADTADDNGVYVVDLTEPDRWSVRRFVFDRELTKVEVERERRSACKHSYMTGLNNESGGGDSIHELFLKMRPKVNQHG